MPTPRLRSDGAVTQMRRCAAATPLIQLRPRISAPMFAPIVAVCFMPHYAALMSPFVPRRSLRRPEMTKARWCAVRVQNRAARSSHSDALCVSLLICQSAICTRPPSAVAPITRRFIKKMRILCLREEEPSQEALAQRRLAGVQRRHDKRLCASISQSRNARPRSEERYTNDIFMRQRRRGASYRRDNAETNIENVVRRTKIPCRDARRGVRTSAPHSSPFFAFCLLFDELLAADARLGAPPSAAAAGHRHYYFRFSPTAIFFRCQFARFATVHV